MKKHFFKAALMSLMFMCTANVNAQTDLGGILGSVLGGSNNGSTGDLVSNLTSVFSSNKQANANNIVGTWSYNEPAIVITSDNLLAKTAYKVAANKVESKLQSYLTQCGITPGTFSMTFNEDGTCSETLKGKSIKGTWKVVDSKLQLTIGGVKAISITTQIDGKDLLLVTDATKLLNLFRSLGANSSNSTIKTVSSLLKSAKGLQAGVALRKQ